MFIVAVGLNHKTAPVEIREKVTFPERTLTSALERLKAKPGVEGCVILSTCNRTEIYVATTDVEIGLAGIKEFLSESSGLDVRDIEDYLYVHTIYGAIRHLFRVASGLDSMVLGEAQILGQVKQVYQVAHDYGATNAVLNTFFQKAVTVGKRVRTETQIDRHAVSIAYAAVELAKQRLGELKGKTVLVVGAGGMSELTALHMISNGVATVMVSNRSYDRALELAEKFDGNAIKFDDLYENLKYADIVISATAAHGCIIKADRVKDAVASRRDNPIFLVDIAVPRDIEPEVGNIPGVILFDIDDLQNVIDRNLDERKRAAVQAGVIIEEEIAEFLKWLGSRFVVPTIIAYKEKVMSIKDTEVKRAMNKLGNISDKDRKTVESLANSIVNQLIHEPIVNLKESSTTHQGHMYAEIFQNLFNLEVEGQKSKKASDRRIGSGNNV